MNDAIHVQPTAALRRAFAVWATAQVPKIRTVDSQTFAVPGRLFTAVPEELLTGSLVDGHRYVSPDDEPPAPPDYAPLENAPAAEADGDGLPVEDVLTSYECADCGRQYATERGLTAHRNRVHGG